MVRGKFKPKPFAEERENALQRARCLISADGLSPGVQSFFTKEVFKAEFSQGSLELRSDLRAIIAAVNVDGNLLTHCSMEAQDNYDIVYAAVSNTGLALKSASARLKDDEALVRRAVHNTGAALQYASKRLREDAATVLEAIPNGLNVCRYAGENLRSNKEFAMQALEREVSSFVALSEEVRDDREVVIAFLQRASPKVDPIWANISQRLREDKDVLLLSIRIGINEERGYRQYKEAHGKLENAYPWWAVERAATSYLAVPGALPTKACMVNTIHISAPTQFEQQTCEAGFGRFVPAISGAFALQIARECLSARMDGLAVC